MTLFFLNIDCTLSTISCEPLSKGANTMIILKFQAPNGEIGFAEVRDSRKALKTAKAYRLDGYRLLDHFRMAV